LEIRRTGLERRNDGAEFRSKWPRTSRARDPRLDASRAGATTDAGILNGILQRISNSRHSSLALKFKSIDTLFLRIFLLLLVAFSISSFLAFAVFRATAPPPPWRDAPPFRQSMHPLLGSTNPLRPPPGAVLSAGPRKLPLISTGLDAVIKIIAVALAAWLAARALSLPMRRLSDAARVLGQSLSPNAGAGTALAPPQLDEDRGTREVRETARVFNDLSRQLKSDFDTQRLMLATVSHDLRTPLARLRMRLSELEAHPAARSAIDDVRQMDELIESLLALFRPPPGPAAGGAGRFDGFALVQAVIDDLPGSGPEVTLSGTPASTPCQPAAFRRMVENLIENAIRHGGEHDTVDVEVTTGPTNVCVTVKDRGPGLNAEQLASAGTPFLRWAGAEADSGRRAGLGLGLYITRALAEREGGRLELAARPGGGLCATLHLPLSG
jgi:signal transduction histidine kinase